jgi:hypothetical protein
MRGVIPLLLWLAVVGCGGARPEPQAAPNPLRREIELTVAAIDASQPLLLRFNPAACDCPAFEVKVGERWLRAELQGGDAVHGWIAWIARSPSDTLPLRCTVRGRVEREVLRTLQGVYALRIEVQEPLSPLPPAELPPTDVPPEPSPETPPPAPAAAEPKP